VKHVDSVAISRAGKPMRLVFLPSK